MWLEEPGSLGGAASVGLKGRIAQAGCHHQEVDPSQPGREGPPQAGGDTDKGQHRDAGTTTASGQRSGLREGGDSSGKGERRQEEVELCRVSTAPTRWHLWEPGGCPPSRLGLGSGRAQRRERRR